MTGRTNDTKSLTFRLVVRTDAAREAAAALGSLPGVSDTAVKVDRVVVRLEEQCAAAQAGLPGLLAHYLASQHGMQVQVTECELDPEVDWSEQFEPFAVSQRVRVGPEGARVECPDEGAEQRVALEVAPGAAFGTGIHPGTRIAAGLVDEQLKPDPGAVDLLDVGCGSAILTMIAAGLGVGSATGVEIDETAVQVARRNLAINGLEEAVDLQARSVAELERQFDVVVAHVVVPVFRDLRDPILRAVVPGGRLIVSGIREAELQAFRARQIPDAWKVRTVRERGIWRGLVVERPA